MGLDRYARRAAEQSEKALKQQQEMMEKERVRMEEEHKLKNANAKERVTKVVSGAEAQNSGEYEEMPKKRASYKASKSLGFK